MVRLHEGVRLVTGGKAINGLGYFIQPTVLADVTDVMAFSWRQTENFTAYGGKSNVDSAAGRGDESCVANNPTGAQYFATIHCRAGASNPQDTAQKMTTTNAQWMGACCHHDNLSTVKL